MDQAQEVVGQEISLPEKDLQPLEKGYYYHYQLSGSTVVTREGKDIGTVKDVLFIQDNDLLVVERRGSEMFIPFTESICVEVNVEKKMIVIDPPPGLLELNDI